MYSTKLFFLSKIANLMFCFLLICSTEAIAQNPFLPPTAFIPDGEPHVFEYKGEKRLFVYGSRDERVTAFCGYGHDVWSAPINDLTKWTDHGEIFNVKQVKDIGYGIVDNQHFGAPDCVYNPVTKKYYLYTFLGASYKMDGKEGPLPGTSKYIPGFENKGPNCVMAQSDSPVGPFTNPVICNWPSANGAGAFDPSVLVDVQLDGSLKVYAFWGMREGDRCAEIDPNDMHTIINPKTRKPDLSAYHKTLDPVRLPNTKLFEASSIKKVADGKYVFIYSSQENSSALTYCYSNNPLGPWKYGGQIVNNKINYKGGNNHGSIVKLNDEWYITYHKQTTNDYNRQAMIEPIEVRIEGDKVIIPAVQMTSQGVLSSGLNAYQRYNANIACYITNGAYIDGKQRNSDGLNPIVNIKGATTTLGFKYFNFGKQAVKNSDDLSLKLNCKVINPTLVTILVALPEEANDTEKRIEIASIDLTPSTTGNGFQDHQIPILDINSNERLKKAGGLQGKLAVFLSISGEEKELFQLKELEFVKHNRPTPNPLSQINIEMPKNGSVTTTSSKSRYKQSVKVSVIPNQGYKVASIRVTDTKNKSVSVQSNSKAPYALESYNFFMPQSAVSIQVEFDKDGSKKQQ
jgi:arabinoxylan arabinofuranohydrolase